jgi:hypothetical protein
MHSRVVYAAIFSLLALMTFAVPATATSPRPVARQAVQPLTAITPNGAWTVYHHDNAHTGFDSSRPAATTASVGWTSPALDETVYGSPLVYQGVVYVGTLNNTVYALNQSDGSVVWSKNLGAPETTGWGCGNVSPQGILGTPVIDAAANRIYVAAFLSTDVYWVFGLDLGAAGNIVLQTAIPTTGGFDWTIQQERGALALANGNVYVPFGGRAGDCGAYHGWIFAVPTNGAAVGNPYVTPGQGAGFWTAGGVVVDDTTGKVFETSGNGTSSGCNANSNGTPAFENDAIVRLSSSLAHEDAFIPQDWRAHWCSNDQDLGSASMVLISPTLAFQSGKWGSGFLVNPQALGGMDGQLYPTPSPAPYSEANVCRGSLSDANFGSYAYAAPYVYLSCEGNGLVALSVNTSTPSFSGCGSTCSSPSWNATGFHPGPPIVAGGAVWAVDINGGGLYGFNATTGAQIYHSGSFGVTHFSTPSEAGGQIFVSAGTAVRSFDMVGGCTGVSMTFSPPMSAAVGTAVTVTGAATGCPNPNPLYQFWTLAPGSSTWQIAQAYSASATFNWATSGKAAGTYGFSVWARDASSAGAFGNSSGRWDAFSSTTYMLTVSACTAVGLSSSPPSTTTIGTPVTFTASASGCPNPSYQFWMLAPGATSWTLAQAYSTTRTFNWATTGKAAGTYGWSVWARDASSSGTSGNGAGTWDAYSSSQYTLSTTAAVTPCMGVSVTSAPPSTTAVGNPVTFTANASGCPNPSYQFWMLAPGASSWTLTQAYSTTKTFNWVTTGKAAGTYGLSVWVRDASSAGTSGNSAGTWDAYSSSQYTLTSTVNVTPCTGLSVSSSPASTAKVGTPVTFTASGSGCPNPSYQFWTLAPGATSWTLAQAYSTTATFNWVTTGKAAGTYGLSVWTRDASSAGTSSNGSGTWDAYNSSQYTLTSTPCTSVSVVSSPSGSATAGTTVTFTAAASGCPNPSYQFWVLAPGATSWTLAQGYSTNATFSWITTGKAAGTYHISVWVRDASSTGISGNSSGTWDAYNSSPYNLS